MATPTLQFKRGLFVNLPSLRAGEPGFTTDKTDLFIGGPDGNKFFGSHRYWVRENATNAAEFKFVDKDGTNGVSLRSPATVTTPVTYTLPEGGGTSGHYLRLGSAGVLEWASVSDGASFDNATLTTPLSQAFQPSVVLLMLMRVLMFLDTLNLRTSMFLVSVLLQLPTLTVVLLMVL
jgi:hypothetical protein